jgi:hypothetical protein
MIYAGNNKYSGTQHSLQFSSLCVVTTQKRTVAMHLPLLGNFRKANRSEGNVLIESTQYGFEGLASAVASGDKFRLLP